MTPPRDPGAAPADGRGASVLKWVVFVVGVLCLAACLLALPCTQQIRDGEGWVESANHVKVIGLALRTYHEVNGRLPPAVVRGKDGRPLYSWRVLLLPYLEQEGLYERFALDEPWDSPHNKPLLEDIPRWYLSPEARDDAPGLTRYQVFVGPGTAFERDGLTWGDFPDGLSNTLLVVAAGDPVPWTKPEDLAYDPGKPLPPLGHLFSRPAVKVLCYPVTTEQGFLGCFADGSVRFLRGDAGEGAVRALITRNGGEKVDPARLE
jgi:hypothetical protein